MSNEPSGLSDPSYRAFAWHRFRVILGWMGLAAVVIVAGAVWLLDYWYGPLSWVAILAAIGGFGGTVMMAAALMGLVFMSSGSGHDEDVDRL
jgi:hypothetical protein